MLSGNGWVLIWTESFGHSEEHRIMTLVMFALACWKKGGMIIFLFYIYIVKCSDVVELDIVEKMCTMFWKKLSNKMFTDPQISLSKLCDDQTSPVVCMCKCTQIVERSLCVHQWTFCWVTWGKCAYSSKVTLLSTASPDMICLPYCDGLRSDCCLPSSDYSNQTSDF